MTPHAMRLASALALIALLALPGCGRSRASSARPRPVKARVLTVEHKDVRRDIESVGSLFPYEEVAVSSEVEGNSASAAPRTGAAGTPVTRAV